MRKTFLQLLLIFLFLNLFFAPMGQSSSLGRESHQLTIIPAHKQEKIYLTWHNKFNPEKPNKVVLLRPKKWALQHGLIPGHDNKQWAVSNGLPVKTVFVSSVTPFHPDKKKSVQPAGTSSNRVTGIYIHDTDNVRTWKFIDRKKHLTIIHATPNHPFYVQNLKKFLPLQKITSAMTLIDDRQHTIHLFCPAQKSRRCGLPYHPGRVNTVYNIEVDQQHQYFVSGEHILVHNCNPPVFEHQLDEDNATGIEATAPVEKPDRSDYLVVGCGSICPSYPYCVHPRVHTLDTDPKRYPTYTDWRKIPHGRYNQVLMEDVPFAEKVMKKDISPWMNPGSKIYVTRHLAADEAIDMMRDIGDFKYSRMLEPEDAEAILRNFESMRYGDLAGKNFFSTKQKEIKVWIEGKRRNKVPRRKKILLEYIKG